MVSGALAAAVLWLAFRRLRGNAARPASAAAPPCAGRRVQQFGWPVERLCNRRLRHPRVRVQGAAALYQFSAGRRAARGDRCCRLSQGAQPAPSRAPSFRFEPAAQRRAEAARRAATVPSAVGDASGDLRGGGAARAARGLGVARRRPRSALPHPGQPVPRPSAATGARVSHADRGPTRREVR